MNKICFLVKSLSEDVQEYRIGKGKTIVARRVKLELVFSSSLNIIRRAKRAPHWGVQSRFRVIYIYMCVCRMSN